jgi:uncharacterized protein (DUF697 family)
MDWISTLEKLAPTVAGCLGTPVAGVAVAALEAALGVTGQDNVQKVIEDGKLNGEQIAAVQQAEIAVKAKAQELGLDFEKLAVDDRMSARSMEIATRSTYPFWLASIVILAFGVVVWIELTGAYKIPDNALIIGLITTLQSGFLLILNYFFGSSSSSQAKDATIHNIVNNQQNAQK